MGNIVQAAKITHVPTIWMSATMEKYKGIRQPAINGYELIKKQAKERNVDTFVVFDTHWIVNQGFHVNAKERHHGTFTSHELPHMLTDLEFDYKGDTELANLIVEEVRAIGQRALAHQQEHLGCQYGTLLPMHFINEGAYARVVPVAVNQFADIEENRRAGEALAKAIQKSSRRVSILASGSMSHEFWPNSKSVDGINTINGEFNRQMDMRVLDMWKKGNWSEFLDLLPEYAQHCHGECGMNDTALLFGALGWENYNGKAEEFTPYFASSGTGQVNMGFSI